MLESHQAEYGATKMPIPLIVSPKLLLQSLADTSSPAWINEDGTLNETEISEYLKQANRIYQTYAEIMKESLSEDELSYLSESEYDRFSYGVSTGSLNLLGGTFVASLGGLYSADQLSFVYSAEQKDNSLTSALWNGQAENVFIPCSVIGISAKAQEKDAAQRFVEYLFSQSSQEMSGSTGFPVNQAAYEGETYWDLGGKDGVVSVMSSTNTETGETREMDILQPSDEAISRIQELGKTLTVSSRTNEIILNAVAEAGARYLNGEIGLEEAARAAIQEVNLYLSE